MDLEKLRFEMIRTFKVFQNTTSDNSRLRDKHWEEYCLNREAFLIQDCYLRGFSYVTLSQTLVIPGPYSN